MFELIASSTKPKTKCLVLPTNRISMHEVLLPPTPPHRLQAALAGLLEEQLLDSPADLHFAIAPDAAIAMKEGRGFHVMACDRAWLTDLVTKVKDQGISFSAIVPESKELQMAGWDLAQFDFRPRSRTSSQVQAWTSAVWRSPSWRWARIAFVALIVVNIIGINVWTWRDRADLAAKRAQINQILLEAYPETKVVMDAPAQMQKSLEKDRAQHGITQGQSMDEQLAEQAVAGKEYSQINYANGELKLQEAKVGTP